MLESFMKLLDIAQKKEPKHHCEDPKRKGWYEVCTTRTVCAEGKRNVSGKLTLFLPESEIEFAQGFGCYGTYRMTERRLEFKKPEEAEAMAERLQKMIPVLQEVAARMKAEL